MPLPIPAHRPKMPPLLWGLLLGAALSLPLSPSQGQALETSPPLSAAQFDALTQGRTMTYAAGGQVYGTEQYLPGRKVRWAFSGDLCKEGHWYEQGPQICFAYDGLDAPQCWTFHNSPEGLRAHFEGDPSEPLVAVADSDQPLACLGPEVGV